MSAKLLDDCFLHDRDRLRHPDALAILRDRIVAVTQRECVTVVAALGRTVAATVASPRSVPSHTNAAVDGYALRHGDYDIVNGSWLPVSGRSSLRSIARSGPGSVSTPATCTPPATTSPPRRDTSAR